MPINFAGIIATEGKSTQNKDAVSSMELEKKETTFSAELSIARDYSSLFRIRTGSD